jgi:hypothetical protein
MAQYVVSYINFFDNDLVSKKVTADSWFEALQLSGYYEGIEFTPEQQLDINLAKNEAFNCDSMFDVLEI